MFIKHVKNVKNVKKRPKIEFACAFLPAVRRNFKVLNSISPSSKKSINCSLLFAPELNLMFNKPKGKTLILLKFFKIEKKSKKKPIFFSTKSYKCPTNCPTILLKVK